MVKVLTPDAARLTPPPYSRAVLSAIAPPVMIPVLPLLKPKPAPFGPLLPVIWPLVMRKELLNEIATPPEPSVLQDIQDQADAFERELSENECIITVEVIAEMVYVLSKVYNVKRKLIAKSIQGIIGLKERLVENSAIVSHAGPPEHEPEGQLLGQCLC
jgi:hypothetical protein